MELKKNALYETEIIDYTTEGAGIGRIDGMTVFVPSTAVGDKVKVKILKVTKHLAYGKVEELIQPSFHRQAVDCAVFAPCGGCTFRHISYEAECAFKQKRVEDTLSRIGGVDVGMVQPIICADNCDGYRNKAQLPVTVDKNGRIAVGFFAPRSHRVIPIESCQLQAPVFNEAMRLFTQWANQYHLSAYDEGTHQGILRHLYLRYAEKTGQLMVCVVANAHTLPKSQELVAILQDGLPCLTTVVLNVNTAKTNVITGTECHTLFGEGVITDELCGLTFRISPLSFYQVNRTQAERLYTTAAECAALQPDETLIDLYCGTGTIGLTMARKVKQLIGVEIVPQAIEDARRNAAVNGIDNAQFICGDAAKAAVDLQHQNIRPDCVIIDPPRKGCEAALVDTIAQMSPQRVVYVSCDPATLARDIKRFADCGYCVQKAVPVDMFPRTPHVETVTLITRAGVETTE